MALFESLPRDPTPVEAFKAALSDPRATEELLPLAQAALASRPFFDKGLLLEAAFAALVAGSPAQAQFLLHRFSMWAPESAAADLLTALMLQQKGRTRAARQLLVDRGLVTRSVWLRAFPPLSHREAWAMGELAAILPREPAKPKTTPIKKPRAAKAETPEETRPPLPRASIDIPLAVAFDWAGLSDALLTAPEPEGRWFAIRQQLDHLNLAQGFDELLCLPHLTGVDLLDHQIETLRKVLKQFRGRVLLADEVGLGKTIEACMALKEYALRRMAEHVLILTPAPLVGQWREELETKFAMPFAATHDPLFREEPARFWKEPRIIASIAAARRPAHAASLAERAFDLVIVDEAHHLRDRTSQSFKLVDSLNKRFLLLLSATPVQNDLVELYNLLTLLKPGIFKTEAEFRRAYMAPGEKRKPANADRLRALMRDAMIRNTRAAVALKLPRRHAATIRLDATAPEREAYAALAEAARSLAASDRRARLSVQHLLASAGSSPKAAAAAAARLASRHPEAPAWPLLAAQWEEIGCSAKDAALMDLIARNPGEKVLVFVERRETLDHLATILGDAGIVFARFEGSLSGPQKDAAIAAFRGEAQVLLCTQSGGEGRNIQFCNTLVNFDVPLNPMAIEQRIGRIDRIGQKREVFVFNLVTRGTIEEEALTLLDEKIAMFELVVGEAGAILGSLEEEGSFSDLVLDAWLETSEEARALAFETLGARLTEARRQHEDAKAFDEALFGDDFEAV
jgi:superfamily II DNA or RNA helicase